MTSKRRYCTSPVKRETIIKTYSKWTTTRRCDTICIVRFNNGTARNSRGPSMAVINSTQSKNTDRIIPDVPNRNGKVVCNKSNTLAMMMMMMMMIVVRNGPDPKSSIIILVKGQSIAPPHPTANGKPGNHTHHHHRNGQSTTTRPNRIIKTTKRMTTIATMTNRSGATTTSSRWNPRYSRPWSNQAHILRSKRRLWPFWIQSMTNMY